MCGYRDDGRKVDGLEGEGGPGEEGMKGYMRHLLPL